MLISVRAVERVDLIAGRGRGIGGNDSERVGCGMAGGQDIKTSCRLCGLWL